MHKHFTEYNGPFQAGVEIYLVQRAGHLEIQKRVVTNHSILNGIVYLQFEAPYDFDQLSLGDVGVPGHAYDYRPQEIFLTLDEAVNALTRIATYWISQDKLPFGINTCKTPNGDVTVDLPAMFATENAALTTDSLVTIKEDAVNAIQHDCYSDNIEDNKKHADTVLRISMESAGLGDVYKAYKAVMDQ